MARWAERLDAGVLRVLGRPLSEPERDAFAKYLSLLLKWQRVHRLVGRANPEWIVIHLILDSLLFLRVLPSEARRVLDLGAGAGIPGVPLAIVRRDLRVTLLEVRQRRASFLAEVVRVLELSNCDVIAGRAEAVVDNLQACYDAVLMRCAGTADEVVPRACPFVKQGGVVVVSGPPAARSTSRGVWVEVEGISPEKVRRFLLVRA